MSDEKERLFNSTVTRISVAGAVITIASLLLGVNLFPSSISVTEKYPSLLFWMLIILTGIMIVIITYLHTTCLTVFP